MIVTRNKFIRLWNERQAGLGDPSSVIWTLENAGRVNPSRWFIKIKPLTDTFNNTGGRDENYWDWCKETLTGTVACYSTDGDLLEEWWGFENHEDIIIWKLKWEGF